MALRNIPIEETGAASGSISFSTTTVIDALSSEAKMLPSGQFASDAQYSKHGTDLHLTGPDGTTVIVRDYFLADPAPDLMTPEGGRLSAELIQSFTPPEAAGQAAQAGPTVLAAAPNASPVGQATSTEGTVYVVRTNGVREQIQSGDPIYQGDVVETADGGAINILFVDKTTFALGEDARLAVDELVYDPSTHHGTSTFSILKGMFVFSSGEIAKIDPTDMTVKTTVATIGIRGTKVAGEVKPAGEESKFTILEGEIVVITDEGFVVLNDANETSFVNGFDAAPTEPVQMSVQEIESFYGDVKDISKDFYGTGSTSRSTGEQQGDAGTEGETTEEQQAQTGEAELTDEELEKLASTLTDVAPASGGEPEVAEELDVEEPIDELVAEFGVVDGFEADEIAPVDVAAPAETETDDDSSTTPVATTTAATNAAPEIAELAAQSVQAEPGLVEHTLSTTAQIDGVDMNDLALTNDHPVTLTFVNEGAGYRSVVGYYKIGENGELTDVNLIWENASKVGSGGNLLPGVSSAELDVEAGDQLAFFIVANGFRRNNFNALENGSFEFRDGQNAATVDSDNPALVFVDEETAIIGNIFHTTEADGAIQLNADGLSHTVSSQDAETGGLTIGFEDLYNLGDQDFDDLVIRADFGPAVVETVSPVAIAPEIALDDDSSILSGAELVIAEGFVSGDVLEIDGLEGTGISVSEQGFDQTAGVYRLTLEGDASTDAYQAAIASVTLSSEGGNPSAGDREISIIVTDTAGLQSDTATVEVSVLSANVIDGSAIEGPIAGTTGNDIIDGGDDDDIIDGAGGSDVVRGHDGDDRIVLNDDNIVLADGGAGTDTVAVNFALDLTGVSDSAFSGIESFDLGGSGAAALTLGIDDVLAATSGTNALTGTEDTLVIQRDTDDSVTVVGDNWDVSTEELDIDGDEISESYTVYSDTATGATVYVEGAALA